MFVIGLGAVSGPVIGGILVDLFGWRAIFVETGVITLSGAILGFIVIDERRVGTTSTDGQGRLDWPGIIASSAGLAILILSLTNGNKLGWDSPFIIGGFLAFDALLSLSLIHI